MQFKWGSYLCNQNNVENVKNVEILKRIYNNFKAKRTFKYFNFKSAIVICLRANCRFYYVDHGLDSNVTVYYFFNFLTQAKEKKNRMKKVRGTKKAKVGAAGKKVRNPDILI